MNLGSLSLLDGTIYTPASSGNLMLLRSRTASSSDNSRLCGRNDDCARHGGRPGRLHTTVKKRVEAGGHGGVPLLAHDCRDVVDELDAEPFRFKPK